MCGGVFLFLTYSCGHKICQKLGCHDWWPTNLQDTCSINCPIMSFHPVQHHEDQTLPVWACRTTSPHVRSILCRWSRTRRRIWSSTSHKTAHVTPLFISLHWLPVAARIKFKTLTLAYKTATKTAPAYLNSIIQVYTPSCSLRSANERLLVPQQGLSHEPDSSPL